MICTTSTSPLTSVPWEKQELAAISLVILVMGEVTGLVSAFVTVQNGQGKCSAVSLGSNFFFSFYVVCISCYGNLTILFLLASAFGLVA